MIRKKIFKFLFPKHHKKLCATQDFTNVCQFCFEPRKTKENKLIIGRGFVSICPSCVGICVDICNKDWHIDLNNKQKASE